MKRTNLVLKIAVYGVMLLIVLVWVVPILWIAALSFIPTQAIIENRISAILNPTLEHYKFIFAKQPFLRYMLNSIVVSLSTTAIAVVVGTLAAYSLSRFNTGGRHFAFWILSTRMAPPAVLIIPFFLMFRDMGLLNTWYVLIFTYQVFNLSFVVWLMRSFFDEVPVEIEEAALVDGASRLGALVRIVMPVVRPGLIATLIFSLVFSWNEFLFALVLSVSREAKTLPVAANDFITGYAINWGPVFGSGVLIIIPIVLFTLIVQRHIVRGLSLGAIR